MIHIESDNIHEESDGTHVYFLCYSNRVIIQVVFLIDSVVEKFGFAATFPAAALQAATTAANHQHFAREDFRQLHLATIDGADARDFDDAVAAAALSGGNFRLWVAIADVAAFVLPGTVLDAESQKRGTSVYLPDRVLPMLPAALSDDACSLNPHEDKLCMMCEMEIDNAGEIQNYRFARGIMRSQRRWIYEEAAAAMDSDKNLQPLAALGRILRQARQNRGAFMMERPEMRAVLSSTGAPELQAVARNEAHWMIEECMIAANRCAADFVIRRRLPALHRVHKKPNSENVKNLTAILSNLGINFPQRPQASDFGVALAAVADKDSALVDCIVPVLLGALSRAEYAADEKTGHFGLSCPRYLHFTSPIRRYPDLLAHRALIAGIYGRKPPPLTAGIGEHCSQTEVAADKAGWECRQRLLCLRAQQNIGEEFDVIVSGATSYGLFINIAALGVDGMLRLASLPGYWRFEPKLRQVVNGEQVLGLGTRLRARLVSVIPEKGRAEFVLAAGYEKTLGK